MDWTRGPGGALVPSGVPSDVEELAALERLRWQQLRHQAGREGPIAADNINILDKDGSVRAIAVDDVGPGVFYQRNKINWGVDGAAVDASNDAPLPVALRQSKNTYFAVIPSQVHVASASNPAWDLFNADAALKLRLLDVRQIPNVTTAVTGVNIDWLFEFTTAVGTGGTTITPVKNDSANAALDADITCRSKPTGGASAGTDIFPFTLSSEETNAATIQAAMQGGLQLLPVGLAGGEGIVLGQNEGVRVTQVTSSSVGNTAWVVTFSVE